VKTYIEIYEDVSLARAQTYKIDGVMDEIKLFWQKMTKNVNCMYVEHIQKVLVKFIDLVGNHQDADM